MSIQSNSLPESIAPKNIKTLVENVQEDHSITPELKETTIRWSKTDDLVHVCTEEAGLIRRFLRHQHFIIDELRVLPETEQSQRVSVTDYRSGPITGVWGRVPIQALKVQSVCRTQPSHCHVVADEGLVSI